MKKIKILALVLAALMLVLCFTGCEQAKEDSSPYGIHHAVIEVKDYGEIHLELDGDIAPRTVRNFVKLAKDGFYDGLTFHRVSKNFVIQGGDPEGNGSGGSDRNITGEFAENGIENELSHKRGVISMARRGDDMNSASSQFFIVLSDAAIPSLDGKYASFGYVTKGMEVVDMIATLEPANPYSGLLNPIEQPVITTIRIVD